jgi:SAM-dependent methyltransferase
MKECSKSIQRRLSDSNFLRKYFVGDGIDIGGKPDPLKMYAEFFPLIRNLKTWDWEDGDAQFMSGVPDESVDFVHSSHCLEHLLNPEEGLRNWLRVIRPSGHIIVTIPDEDMYEQGIFPSTFNRDHKRTFTIFKERSWSPCSVNVLSLLSALGPAAEVLKVECLHGTHRYSLPRFDQTMTPVGESAIEFILRKRSSDELAFGGTPTRSHIVEDRETRLHLNQYRDDQKTLRAANPANPPFCNDSPIHA